MRVPARPRRAWLASLAYSWLCLSQVAQAGPLVVTLEVVGQRSGEMVTARVVATPHGITEKGLVEHALVTGEARLNLEPGTWSLKATTDGHWSPQTTVSMADSEVQVLLRLWPTGLLAGHVQGPVGEMLPDNLHMLFRSVPGVTPSSTAIPLGRVECPIVDTTWRCEVPAGLLDLQMAAAGFIRRFLWDVEMEAGEITRLRDVVLRRGSSVFGWVVSEDGSRVDGTDVELLPSAAVQQSDPIARRRASTLKLATVANHRGFFQLDAVKPGDYVLTASREPLASARVTVRVLEGQATEIADPPMTLRLPRKLEVFVDPPSPPGTTELWAAELLQLDTRGNVVGKFAEGVVPLDGTWLIEAISVGNYLLSITTTDGDRWHQEMLAVEENPQPAFVTIPAVEIRGNVRIGKKPLQAHIKFGGKYGSQNVGLDTDEEGSFAGLLPRPGRWKIEIEAAEPPLIRRVQKEVVEGEDLDIVFPDTRVTGLVVDEEGRGVGRAIVRVTHLDEPRATAEPRTDHEGRFEIVGLPTGRTVFMAEDANRYSDSQEFMIAEKMEMPEFRLVLRRMLRLTGRVVSDAGGVPGARITAISVQAPFWGSPISTSGADGNFELALPALTQEMILNVGAPGFAFRTLRTAAEEPLIVPVQPESGLLTLELPESLDRTSWQAPAVAIFHNSGSVGLPQLLAWAGFHGSAPTSNHRFSIPFMEPGAYSLCLVRVSAANTVLTGDRTTMPCASGNLLASGELSLTLSDMGDY